MSSIFATNSCRAILGNANQCSLEADIPSGPTRKETRLSEAQSYANIAAAHNHWDSPASSPTLRNILVENRALDSYHNVLFSMTLFHSNFHTWPTRVRIVSHAFKQPRLVDGHCRAIGLPEEAVTFVGIDPPGMMAALQSVEGKAMFGVAQAVDEWTKDPHGRGESLAGKRKRRNPWGVWQGVFESRESEKGRLVTVGEGEEEKLVEDAERPWSA